MQQRSIAGSAQGNAVLLVNGFIDSCHQLRSLSAWALLPLQEDNSGCAASPKVLGDSPSSPAGRIERRDTAGQKLHMWLLKARQRVRGISYIFFSSCAMLGRKLCSISICCNTSLLTHQGLQYSTVAAPFCLPYPKDIIYVRSLHSYVSLNTQLSTACLHETELGAGKKNTRNYALLFLFLLEEILPNAKIHVCLFSKIINTSSY